MRTFAFTAVATALSAVLIGAGVVYAFAATAAAGQTWRKNGLTIGEDLQLLDSGAYIQRPWCDICPPQSFEGRWAQSGDRITLTPNSGAPPRFLRKRSKHGCEALVSERWLTPGGDFSTAAAYYRADDDCLSRAYAAMLSKAQVPSKH